jgi:hypothetical protein
MVDLREVRRVVTKDKKLAEIMEKMKGGWLEIRTVDLTDG